MLVSLLALATAVAMFVPAAADGGRFLALGLLHLACMGFAWVVVLGWPAWGLPDPCYALDVRRNAKLEITLDNDLDLLLLAC